MVKKVIGRSTIANQMNFRPSESKRAEKKGSKPLPDPTPITQVLLLMIIHLCRKVLFVDPNIKVGIYILVVFFGSILGDVLPLPKTYFARKENIFNVYFVKLSWGWTMSLVSAFVYMTSSIYCLGETRRIRRHFLRLILATCMWLFWTNSFIYVEETYGFCGKANVRSGKKQCLSKGLAWHSFSISGHTFILIYCTLIIMEEAKALVGWEQIRDHLRNEEHNRSQQQSTVGDTGLTSTPLELLSQVQLDYIRERYEKFTPYIRVCFIGMTVLVLIFDLELIGTIFYFHSTPEKFVASVISVLIWFLTYRFLFTNRVLSMCLPGEGVFRYMNIQPLQTAKARRSSIISKNDMIPTFMGMPLNVLKNQTAEETSPSQSVATEERFGRQRDL